MYTPYSHRQSIVRIKNLLIPLLVFILITPLQGFPNSLPNNSRAFVTTGSYVNTIGESSTESVKKKKPDWVVRVKGRPYNFGESFDCTAVAVTPDWLVTSSTCTGTINKASCLEVEVEKEEGKFRKASVKSFVPFYSFAHYFFDPSSWENLDRYDLTIIQLTSPLPYLDIPKINTNPLDEETLSLLAPSFEKVDTRKMITGSGVYSIPVNDINTSPDFYFTFHNSGSDEDKSDRRNFVLYKRENGGDLLYALCSRPTKGQGLSYNCQSIARGLTFLETTIRAVDGAYNCPQDGIPRNGCPQLNGLYNYTVPNSWLLPWTPLCTYSDGFYDSIVSACYTGMGLIGLGIVIAALGITIKTAKSLCPSKRSTYIKL